MHLVWCHTEDVEIVLHAQNVICGICGWPYIDFKVTTKNKKKKNAYDDVLAGSSDNPRYFSSGPTQSPS